MKVAVVSAPYPFLVGGAEILAGALIENLRREGHDASLVSVAYRGHPFEILPKEIEMTKNMRLDSADKVIAIKFPAYFVPHEQRVVWLLHQYRGAYDLYGTPQSIISDDDRGAQMIDFLRTEDVQALSGSARLFTSSPVTRDRLLRYNGLDSEVLLHPIHSADQLTGGEPQGYIFAGGRVSSLKRQDLILEALALTSSKVRLIMAGPPDSAYFGASIEAKAARLGLGDRLILRLGFWDRQQVIDWVNHSVACAYIPIDEDSMSYFAMEAANAKKAIITTTDSGGVLDLVSDGDTGWVVPPDPQELADAMDAAVAAPGTTRRRGEALGEYWQSLQINWPTTIARLLS